MEKTFNFNSPDYLPIFRDRVERLGRIRKNPDCIPALKIYYKDNPSQFINDWCVTFDPRNVERGIPTVIPFILFPKQKEFVEWTSSRWKSQENGIAEKTRDMGLSWLSVAIGCTLCLFNEGLVVGFGSRKEEYVDRIGSPKSLFWKARMLLENIPPEFKGGWDSKKHAPHMRINFPGTGSAMTGEAGDGIGRGDRASIYFVDEAAFLDRPQLVEASLSQTTNCRIDISTPHGMSNPFAVKRHSGKVPIFTFHWRDDPRKGDAWYLVQKKKLDSVTVAQEVDINYNASVEGVVIPSEWVQSAIGSHKKLGIRPTGKSIGTLDVADEGKDKNAFLTSKGILLLNAEQWSGKGSDIYETVEKAFTICDLNDLEEFEYDADGLGAGVRGDARVINNARKKKKQAQKKVTSFRGSSAVYDPEGEIVKGRRNQDMFLNAKAQGWWALRIRFQNTHRAVADGADFDQDEIISISEEMPDDIRVALIGELSQPTYSFNATGKMLVNKTPDGMKSPNLSDTVMIRFAPKNRQVDYGKLL